jgi:hypothetical protein
MRPQRNKSARAKGPSPRLVTRRPRRTAEAPAPNSGATPHLDTASSTEPTEPAATPGETPTIMVEPITVKDGVVSLNG